MSEKCLQFAPFSSAVDAGFWWKLCKKKLDVYKLNDITVDIHGFYSNGDPPHIPGRLNVDYTAFDDPWKIPPRSFVSKGSLICKNTIEEFRECDKKQLLSNTAELIWASITSGDALKSPSLLNKFLLLTYVAYTQFSPCFTYVHDVTGLARDNVYYAVMIKDVVIDRLLK